MVTIEPFTEYHYKKHSHLLMKMNEPLINHDFKEAKSLLPEDE